MASVNTKIRDDGIEIFIPTDYLKNAFEMGLTTNAVGSVTDNTTMLKHFAKEFKDGDNDSFFGRFIDSVCEDAIEQGESFVTCEDY